MAKLKLTNAIAEDLKTAASDSFIDSLKMIEIEDIQPNEDNFYEMSEIEELAEDILTSSAKPRISRYSATCGADHFNVCAWGGQGRASISLICGNSSRKRITVLAANVSKPRAPPVMKHSAPLLMQSLTALSSFFSMSAVFEGPEITFI